MAFVEKLLEKYNKLMEGTFYDFDPMEVTFGPQRIHLDTWSLSHYSLMLLLSWWSDNLVDNLVVLSDFWHMPHFKHCGITVRSPFSSNRLILRSASLSVFPLSYVFFFLNSWVFSWPIEFLPNYYELCSSWEIIWL